MTFSLSVNIFPKLILIDVKTWPISRSWSYYPDKKVMQRKNDVITLEVIQTIKRYPEDHRADTVAGLKCRLSIPGLWKGRRRSGVEKTVRHEDIGSQLFKAYLSLLYSLRGRFFNHVGEP